MEHPIYEAARAMGQQLVAMRRDLHQIPEVGTVLPRTVAYVSRQLDEMNIAHTVYGDCSCIVATIGTGGKCFLLRSDMDGLPVVEESGLPFASQNGCMHGCGHDLHTATLLGAAKILKDHEAELSGTVKLLFQAGEETFTGAKAALDHGILENPEVNAAFAMHVFAAMPAGQIVYGEYAMASVYGFRINLKGRGTHGSMPHTGVDPITTGVHICLGLEQLMAREVSAHDEASLTIGQFHAGSAANVIPEKAFMEGTMRAFSPELARYLRERIQDIAHTMGKAYRTEVSIDTLSLVPPTICDRDLNEAIVGSIRNLAPGLDIGETYHVMGSEDFAFICEKVPSSYFAIGAGVANREEWVGQHNPAIKFDESILPLATAIYAIAAMDWLKNHA